MKKAFSLFIEGSSSMAEHWSANLTLDGLNNTKQAFEISNKSTKRKYMLSYDCVPLPGVFYRTKLVTVTPRFLIVNRMDEKIYLYVHLKVKKNERWLHKKQQI